MASDNQFIPGICNFCNRWCERCSKSQNCLSFAYEQEKKGIDIEENNNDKENKKFWNAIEQSLKTDSAGLIQNLSLIATPEASTQNIITIAETHNTNIHTWLKENNDILKEKASLEVAKYDNNKIVLLSDAVNILKCYATFISKKITRSLNDLGERTDNNFNKPNNAFRDNIGSAKSTIIACNHSIAALSLLSPKLENQQDKIQSFISNLFQIKSLVLKIFPETMRFKRPGFDA